MGVLKPPVFTLGKIKQLHKALIQECLNMFPRHKYPFWIIFDYERRIWKL